MIIIIIPTQYGKAYCNEGAWHLRVAVGIREKQFESFP